MPVESDCYGEVLSNIEMKPVLTVVVISYNARDYIGKAVSSIVMQDLSSLIEVLFYDDGSQDGTIEIINELIDRYSLVASLTVMDHSTGPRVPSMRVSRMIREALKEANGRYVSVLSGDDYYIDESALSLQVEFLEREENSYFSICATSFMKVYDADRAPLTVELFPHSASFDVKDYWAAGKYVHVSACVFRSPSLLSRLAEFYDLNFIDDAGFLFMAGKFGKACYIPRQTFAYRQHDGSIMDDSSNAELELIELLLMAEVLKLSRGSICAFAHHPYIYLNRVLNGEAFPDELIEKYVQSIGDRRYGKLRLEGNIAVFSGGFPMLLVRARRLLSKMKYKVNIAIVGCLNRTCGAHG